MTKVNAEDKQAALAEWRARHFEELDLTLTVLKSIRDNPRAKDKDRVDASKAIARMLDAVTPEKIEKGSGAGQQKKNRDKPELSPELRERLDGLLRHAG
jgi:CO dehydrogenase/acetyl-CoA synthase delta subunit